MPLTFLIIRDSINKHKAAATASELREAQLRDELAVLGETALVGLARIDLDGHFISANDSWYQIVNLEKGRPLDEWVHELHPDDSDWVFEKWRRYVALRSSAPPVHMRLQ